VANWQDYTDGERIKILRGKTMTQAGLASSAGLSLATVQKAEQDRQVSLQTLLALAEALHTHVSVILGQQVPQRAESMEDRSTLAGLSRAVHDTAAGQLDAEPAELPTLGRIRTAVDHAWSMYWAGRRNSASLAAARLVRQAGVLAHQAPADGQGEALAVLSDAYRLAAYVANLMNRGDLAYASIGHAKAAAERAGDPLREALVASGRAWVMLRDVRLAEAQQLAEDAAYAIEPRYSDTSPEQLAAFGCHVTFAGVVASRRGDAGRASDLMSQGHAAAARLGREVQHHGVLFGPVSAAAQAVGVSVALGEHGKALDLAATMGDWGQLTTAARNRFTLDVALAQCGARRYEEALDTLYGVCAANPEWARQESIPATVLQRAGRAATARVRELTAIIGTPLRGL